MRLNLTTRTALLAAAAFALCACQPAKHSGMVTRTGANGALNQNKNGQNGGLPGAPKTVKTGSCTVAPTNGSSVDEVRNEIAPLIPTPPIKITDLPPGTYTLSAVTAQYEAGNTDNSASYESYQALLVQGSSVTCKNNVSAGKLSTPDSSGVTLPVDLSFTIDANHAFQVGPKAIMYQNIGNGATPLDLLCESSQGQNCPASAQNVNSVLQQVNQLATANPNAFDTRSGYMNVFTAGNQLNQSGQTNQTSTQTALPSSVSIGQASGAPGQYVVLVDLQIQGAHRGFFLTYSTSAAPAAPVGSPGAAPANPAAASASGQTVVPPDDADVAPAPAAAAPAAAAPGTQTPVAAPAAQ